MIYHYFGSKESLYLAALERVYRHLRSREEKLDLLYLDSLSAMSALVEFTFDQMLEHQEFIRMLFTVSAHGSFPCPEFARSRSFPYRRNMGT